MDLVPRASLASALATNQSIRGISTVLEVILSRAFARNVTSKHRQTRPSHSGWVAAQIMTLLVLLRGGSHSSCSFLSSPSLLVHRRLRLLLVPLIPITLALFLCTHPLSGHGFAGFVSESVQNNSRINTLLVRRILPFLLRQSSFPSLDFHLNLYTYWTSLRGPEANSGYLVLKDL